MGRRDVGVVLNNVDIRDAEVELVEGRTDAGLFAFDIYGHDSGVGQFGPDSEEEREKKKFGQNRQNPKQGLLHTHLRTSMLSILYYTCPSIFATM